jgi:4-diphosphocytidyl-2-C-methyl-D-erythritol kinase
MGRIAYNRFAMGVVVRSFAKINLGLCIGARRAEGFHDLRTVYQTIGLHDLIRVDVVRGRGIEIRCEDGRVPRDETNTCWRIAGEAMPVLRARGRVIISIEKRLPVRGGLGGASGNAVAALLGLERAVKRYLSPAQKLEIAGRVGSDLPLFLVGGTVLGVGRGEEVYPLVDLPEMVCVVALPEVGVSTPDAFRDWDRAAGQVRTTVPARVSLHLAGTGLLGSDQGRHCFDPTRAELTHADSSDRINLFGRRVSGWLNSVSQFKAGTVLSGVPGSLGGGRVGNPLLDLVRTGIENDFEHVVFPKYPELREVKRVLEAAGAFYASLSGSGSALYGLFASQAAAKKAAARLGKIGTRSVIAKTLRRSQYWKKWLVREF